MSKEERGGIAASFLLMDLHSPDCKCAEGEQLPHGS
jgi:hypothetical protein